MTAFASDSLTSVAYVPEEILLVFMLGGLAAATYAGWIGVVAVTVMAVTVAAYRNNIRAYPAGGDYVIARANLGVTASVMVGAAMLVDFVLIISLTMSSAAAHLAAISPWISSHRTLFASVCIVWAAVIHRYFGRAIRRSLSWIVYGFLATLACIMCFGLWRIYVGGEDLTAASAGSTMPDGSAAVGAVAIAIVCAKAFSSAHAALTGVEAIGGFTPRFAAPSVKNAQVTVVIVAVITALGLLGVLLFSLLLDIRVDHRGDNYGTVISQITATVCDDNPVVLTLVMVLCAAALIIAAGTALHGFPPLAALLAKDKLLPSRLSATSDDRVSDWSIIALAIAAIMTVVIAQANISTLIHMYLIGFFTAFTLSQWGMVRHWTRHSRHASTAAGASKLRSSRVVNGVAFAVSIVVYCIVIFAKLSDGAWIVITVMALLGVMMIKIRSHYLQVQRELRVDSIETAHSVLPTRTHVIILISNVHLPTMRALSYARAIRPDVIEAVTVAAEPDKTARLVEQWETTPFDIPLRVLHSPRHDVSTPVVDYIHRLRSDSPRDVVSVFIPEYVVGKWWEQLLHNHHALRLKTRLLFERGVMVTSVPWQIGSLAGHNKESRTA